MSSVDQVLRTSASETYSYHSEKIAGRVEGGLGIAVGIDDHVQ